MSVPLPIVDMSVYPVGTGDEVTLDKAKLTQPSSHLHADEQAHLRVFNDSGSHLKVWMDTGDLNEYLPAGGWLTWAIDQTSNAFHWQVVNVLPNAPVQLMFITYYKQGEDVPQIPTLGNSPIGGAVATTGGPVGTASQLLNVGNSAPTNVIDVQPSGAPSPTITADNAGNFTLSQYISATLTQLFAVLAGVAAGNANIVIGDASHIIQLNALVEGFLGAQFQGIFAGQSAVVQAYSSNNQPIFEAFMNHDSTSGFETLGNNANINQVGHTSFDGNSKVIGFQANSAHLVGFDYQGNAGDTAYRWNNGRIVAHNVTNRIESTSTTDIAINAPTGQKISFDNNIVEKARVDANGLSLISGTLNLLAGSISKLRTGFASTVTTGTAITHGLGQTPSFVFLQPNNNFSAYVSANGATTFTIVPSVNGNCWWMAGAP
jgi:hypothetical protein